MAQTALEIDRGLEQMRALEYNKLIMCVLVNTNQQSIDSKEDVTKLYSNIYNEPIANNS